MNKRFCLLFLWLLGLLALTVHAQVERRPELPWPDLRPPRLVLPPVTEPGQPMQLRAMEVHARIVGLQVETTTTLSFFNPNHRPLEGELQFPLPPGAVVTGYALDINGQMIDGVIVKKEAARVAFETEVRRGIDPGLVEHVAGNLYRTRIYPLPAQGTRQIRLRYVAELPANAQGDAAWLLPMPRGESIAKLSLRIEVAQGSVKPELGGFGNLRFESLDNLWVAAKELADTKPGEDLWVALPKLPAQFAAVERTAAGEFHFAISHHLPALGLSQAAPRFPRLGIAWDASGSRSRDLLPKEIAALKTLGTGLSLLVFRDRPEPITPLADAESLKNIAYDGGTDLAAAAAVIRNSDIDHWLLFTDGFDTLGNQLPDFGAKQVTAVVSSTLADRELLRQLCSQVIDLQRLDPGFLLQTPTRLAKIEGSGLAEVQGLGQAVDGRVSVHGKLTGPVAEVVLVYSDGRRSGPIKLEQQTARTGSLLASVWAAQRINQLAVRAAENEPELLSLGRRFGIVSPATSLLVLENLEQYVRHDIEPPAGLPTIRAQWQEQKALQTKQTQKQQTDKLQALLGLWRERVAWWEREYKVAAGFKYKADRDLADRPHTPMGGAAIGMADPARFDRRRNGAAPHRAPAGPEALAEAPPSPAMAGERAGHVRSVASAVSIGAAPTGPTIRVKPWDPATPYLKAIKNADRSHRYDSYLDLRHQHAASPAFFLDCAELFLREGDTALGIRILTNLAELKLEEASLLRVLAWRLQQAGELDRAIAILRKIQRLRPEEPHSHRDLALALAEAGQQTEAIGLLTKVVLGTWDGRFNAIELIALEELNALLARTKSPAPPALDPRLLKNLETDLRIVMAWDADLTDVDLHVVEPTEEEAAYNHNLTTIGGLVSRDFTQGYGPEEYLLRRAQPGVYKVFAHYYGSGQQTVIGPCTITATVFTDFGRPTQKQQVLTLRLDSPKDRADLGQIQFGTDGQHRIGATSSARDPRLSRGRARQ